MARDRQRAKQRKQRQAPQPSRRRDEGAGAPEDVAGTPEDVARTPEDGTYAEQRGAADEGNGLPDPDHLHRENVQGAWQHGGEVDEAEAAIVVGAGGEPETDPEAVERAVAAGDGGDDLGGATVAGAGAGEPPAGGGAVTATSPTEPARGRGGSRFLNFLRASWAELQRVQWPDRRQVGQATMVVLGFVIVAGAFLGFADFVAERVVDLII